MEPAVRRSFVELASCTVHVAESGSGPPVLLLHQTPRSCDEYRDVLPLLGRRRRAIAMDTVGFGDSDKPDWARSIEDFARVAAELLDALRIDRAAVVGHHTGGVIAVELAAEHPERVERLVLSSTPLVDEDSRRAHGDRPIVDDVDTAADGSHLAALWQGRMAFYPPDRPDLLERFVLDALKAGENTIRGHLAVAAYEMEKKLPRIEAPTLVLGATADPFAYPELQPLADRIAGSRTAEIEGGMVPLPDQLPEDFARHVLEFLEALDG